MSKNILVLTGSPRKNGNSEAMADAFIRGALKAGHHAEKFRTADKTIAGCRACGTCFSSGTPCTYRDDFALLEPLLEKTDVLVLCTPVYWFDMTSFIRAAIERMHAYSKHPLPIRECALLICAGDKDTHVFGGAVEAYKNMARHVNWKDRGMLIVPGVNNIGDIEKTSALKDADEMGKRM